MRPPPRLHPGLEPAGGGARAPADEQGGGGELLPLLPVFPTGFFQEIQGMFGI
jgi:hypothetical protein